MSVILVSDEMGKECTVAGGRDEGLGRAKILQNAESICGLKYSEQFPRPLHLSCYKRKKWKSYYFSASG